jgi:hypothetical protein
MYKVLSYVFLCTGLVVGLCTILEAKTAIPSEVSDFWGGLCSGASGSNKECCLWPTCSNSGPGLVCSSYGNATACAAGWYRTKIATGYSCQPDPNCAHTCTKSNVGTCAQAHACWWDTTAVPAACKDNVANNPAYLNCITG